MEGIEMLQAQTPAWVASWIEPVEADDVAAVQRPAYHLATEFHVGGAVRSASLRVTAHGVFEAYVNGERVGDAELSPGFTAYRKRLQVIVFDVSALVRGGDNALGILLSDGWWRGQHGTTRLVDRYGPTVAALAELHVTLADGSTTVVGTDGTWRCTTGHVLGADMVGGEVHDMRLRRPDWARAGADRTAWSAVTPVDHGYATLCDQVGPPARRVQELAPVAVTEPLPGRIVVDFGQNSTGWVRLTDLGPRDTTTTIIYGETLAADGTVTQANVDGTAEQVSDGVKRPFQTDVVTSAGDGAVFEPRFSTKGFRYVQLEGHPGPIDPASIRSIVVHSDVRPVGGFECSDERVNRLHDAAVWSFRGNACEIPTDCPTRERAGWTGDWQIFVATAAYLYDVTDWSRKWLLDLAAEQRPDGKVLAIVPDPWDFDGGEEGLWPGVVGSSGWGDAVCHVPWELHLSTGRTDVLGESYEAMKRWVDFAAWAAEVGRFAARAEARPEPLPHEKYLWDVGFHWGEWLEPGIGTMEEVMAEMQADMGPTATAFLHRSALEVSRIATLLGHDGDAARYGELAERSREAWQIEFIDPDGHVQPAKQANLVRALAFDLVPADLRQQTADDLVALIRTAGTHLGTGFLATPFLLPVLADTGHLDVAYELLFQDSEPSWMVMIDRGATTVWEHWNGIDEHGEAHASLNHYSKGAVISFLHRYTAGLQLLEPGYRRFRVAPRPGGGISWARTHHDSPYGRIEVSWSLDGDAGAVEVMVPEGTSCELLQPNGASEDLAPGRHRRPLC